MTNSILGRPTAKRNSVVRRLDVPADERVDAPVESAEKPADQVAGAGEEKCPVIRASRIMFSSATSGRLKVVFF